MLNENLKQFRKSKGMTQEELALELNVVRQTVSKWEKGLSVPDSEMLIEVFERFDVPVSTLLGETIKPSENEGTIQIISEKLALLNERLARTAETKRRWIRSFSFAGIAVIVGYLIWLIVTMNHLNTLSDYAEDANKLIIGGADMPTSIFVSSSGIDITTIIIMAAILSISICGICLTGRK